MNTEFFQKNKYGIIFFIGFLLTVIVTGLNIVFKLLINEETFDVTIFGSVVFEQNVIAGETIREIHQFPLGFAAVLMGLVFMGLFKAYESMSKEKSDKNKGA